VVVDYPLHVVQRGINGSNCFFTEGDYRSYLQYVSEFSARFACSIHAYCLMTNHVHLLLTPHRPDACGLFMKNLGQNYVQRVNHRLNRSGTLWEGRYYSGLIPSDHYLFATYRYIERNPVRAGMVATPADYPWSSHRANADGRQHEFLRPHPSYTSVGAAAYKTMCEEDVSERMLEEIRKATRLGSSMGAPRKGRGRPHGEK
jgi:putative transposase